MNESWRMDLKIQPLQVSAYRPPTVTRPAAQTMAQEPVDLSLSTAQADPKLIKPGQLQWSSFVQPQAETLAKGLPGWEQTPASGLADLAARYFSQSEFQALNSGTYHNVEHPLVVAEAAGGFAQGLGWSPERKLFIQQVALLHDADDRSQVGSEEAKVGTPARAQVTLEWMDQQQEALRERFDWSPEQFTEAKALIARTDFPFDDKPKKPMGTRYDEQSPVQVYKDLLEQLPKEKQAQVLRDGLALRFADQAGFYAGSFDQAVQSVEGLALELQTVGVPTDLASSLKFTPKFLVDVGKDTGFDRQLAGELGHTLQLPGRDELLSSWEPAMAQRFRSNSAQFDFLAQAVDSLPPQDVTANLASLKESARSVYRLTTGRTPS